jgi:hypothetical protein
MTIIEEVDTPYVSEGELQLILVLFLFDWLQAVGYLRFITWRFTQPDGFCLQVFAEAMYFVLAAVDALALFYVARSNDGKRELWQACIWLSLSVRFIASFPAAAISKKYLGWGIGFLFFVEAGLIASVTLMFVATDPTTNVGPYLGLFAPLGYGFLLIYACCVYGNCCSDACCAGCCSYQSYSQKAQDFSAWDDHRGAYHAAERARYAANGIGSTPMTKPPKKTKSVSSSYSVMGGYRQPATTEDD